MKSDVICIGKLEHPQSLVAVANTDATDDLRAWKWAWKLKTLLLEHPFSTPL